MCDDIDTVREACCEKNSTLNQESSVPDTSLSECTMSEAGSAFLSASLCSSLTKISKDWRQKLQTSLTNARFTLTSISKSKFSNKSLINMFGEFYLPNGDDDKMPEEDLDCVKTHDTFVTDFSQIMWFTYRTNFKVQLDGGYDTDSGWGCMLRCGQMLLARTLHTHYRVYSNNNDCQDERLRRWIICQFLEDGAFKWDTPCDNNPPFSLHQLVDAGATQRQYKCGDWFAPGATAHILRTLLQSAVLTPPTGTDRPLLITVASDGLVCTDELDAACCTRKVDPVTVMPTHSKECHAVTTDNDRLFSALGNFDTQEPSWDKSLLLIVPLRLGAERLNMVYVGGLKKLLAMQYCVGLMGGRPKRSLYIVGWHDEATICLDPHYCHESLSIDQQQMYSFSLESFTCTNPHKMSFSEMDPSFAIGFYIKDRNDLISFYADILDVCSFGVGDSTCKNVLFSVLYSRSELFSSKRNKMSKNKKQPHYESQNGSLDSSSSQGYVLL